MLYHDFDKFKREATQLKKLLREANPDSTISLTQCQNWIAASVPDTHSFNVLYLAHQARRYDTQKRLQPQFVLNSLDPLLDEWFEFATFPAQRDWINRRRDRLVSILMSERSSIDPRSIDSALQTLWAHHVCNQRLGDALVNKKNASFSMLSEKEWRNGILLGGKSERKYLRFLEGCLPKLARDGGILTLSLTQARAFHRMWEASSNERRVQLRFFDLDMSRKTLGSTELQKHTCWPEFNFKSDQTHFDAEFRALRCFQNSMLCDVFSTTSENMYHGRAAIFLEAYLAACGTRFNPAIKPDIQILLRIVQDQGNPFLARAGVATYLSALNVRSDTDPTSIGAIREVSVEQHNYRCPFTLEWSDTFTHPQQVASRVTLSDWAASPGLSIFILPEQPDTKDSTMILGMLSVLCEHQVKQAITGTIGSLSKGLLVPASPAVAVKLPVEMQRPPAALRHHSLWGWVRLAQDVEFSFTDDTFSVPQLASDSEGTAVWLTGRPHSTLRSRGLGVFSRLNSGTGTADMYTPWSDAISGTLFLS